MKNFARLGLAATAVLTLAVVASPGIAQTNADRATQAIGSKDRPADDLSARKKKRKMVRPGRMSNTGAGTRGKAAQDKRLDKDR